MSARHQAPGRGSCGAAVVRALIVGIAALAAITALAPAVVLVPVARALVLDEPARAADAVVLTPEMTRSAVHEAVDLRRQGIVGRLLVANVAIEGPPGTAVDQWSDLVRRELAALAVPDEALAVVDGRPCTVDEYLVAIRAAVATHGFRRLIVLAPQLETRRSQGAWTAALAPAGVEVQIVAYAVRQVSLDHWWTTRAGVSAVFNGYLGYLFDLVPMGPFPACTGQGRHR